MKCWLFVCMILKRLQNNGVVNIYSKSDLATYISTHPDTLEDQEATRFCFLKLELKKKKRVLIPNMENHGAFGCIWDSNLRNITLKPYVVGYQFYWDWKINLTYDLRIDKWSLRGALY